MMPNFEVISVRLHLNKFNTEFVPKYQLHDDSEVDDRSIKI
jgi:hypothetical protein